MTDTHNGDIGRFEFDARDASVQWLLESLPDAVVVVSGTGEIVFANRLALGIFGHGDDDLVGKGIEILLPEAVREAHVAHRSGYADEPRMRRMGDGYDLVGLRADGSRIPLQISLCPVRSSDGLIVLAIIRDLSEREEHAAELAHQKAMLEEANAERAELKSALDRNRAMSSIGAPARVTGASVHLGPVRDQHPALFESLAEEYRESLAVYLETLLVKGVKPRAAMEAMVTALGDVGGGPRDLLDIHMAALDQEIRDAPTKRALSITVESRLFVLEMMGLLVDYYRTGSSRRIPLDRGASKERRDG